MATFTMCDDMSFAALECRQRDECCPAIGDSLGQAVDHRARSVASGSPSVSALSHRLLATETASLIAAE
jgi:hypothetical protein